MTKKTFVNQFSIYFFLILFAIIAFFPVFWTFSSSFKSLENVFSVEIKWFPEQLHFENYLTVWQARSFHIYFMNSTLVAISVTFTQLFFSSLGGYGLAKFNFPGRDIIFVFIISTMMIPILVIAIPRYLIVRQFGWVDTYWGLIVPGAMTSFGVFLMRQFIQTIPNDIIDAARVDGCSELRIFWTIILPSIKPALATLGILTFLDSWNNLFWPLIIIQTEKLKTVPLGLVSIAFRQYGVEYNVLMAAAVLASIPVIVMFSLLHKHLTKTIIIGGLKG